MAVAPAQRGRPVDTEKLERMLAVAKDQFAKRGYHPVTMREVAEIANVSTRTLYKHYADKLSLFAACMDANVDAFSLPQRLTKDELRAQLLSLAISFADYLTLKTNMQSYYLIVREGNEFPEIRAAARTAYEEHLVLPLAKLFRGVDLEKRGETRRTRLFLSMISAFVYARTFFGEPSMSAREQAQHAEVVVDTFLNGTAITR